MGFNSGFKGLIKLCVAVVCVSEHRDLNFWHPVQCSGLFILLNISSYLSLIVFVVSLKSALDWLHKISVATVLYFNFVRWTKCF